MEKFSSIRRKLKESGGATLSMLLEMDVFDQEKSSARRGKPSAGEY